MAFFAQLDDENKVIGIFVIDDDDVTDADGCEDEELGVSKCLELIGPGPWVQTCYNGSKRRRYAGVGMTYSAEHDAFILPKPYPSWTLNLNDNDDWVAPSPIPDDEAKTWVWDEDTLQWQGFETRKKPQVVTLGE